MEPPVPDSSDRNRTPATGQGTSGASSIDNLPRPIPQFIDLGDYFVRGPRLWDGEVDTEALDLMLAMTVDERMCWHQCWSGFIKEAVDRGENIGELVYGQPCPYESSS